MKSAVDRDLTEIECSLLFALITMLETKKKKYSFRSQHQDKLILTLISKCTTQFTQVAYCDIPQLDFVGEWNNDLLFYAI